MVHHFWSSWWHHSGNFPSGQHLLWLPLFAWNRAAKVLLYTAGLVIVADIIGHKEVENTFTQFHATLHEAMKKLDRGRAAFQHELETWRLALRGLFRSLFSSRKKVQEVTQGRKSLFLGVTVLVVFAASLSIAFLLALGWLLVSPLSFLQRMEWAVATFFICFFVLFLSAVLLLLIAAEGTKILAALVRPVDRLTRAGSKKLLNLIRKRGAVMSLRWASLGLLTTGFLLDLFTS